MLAPLREAIVHPLPDQAPPRLYSPLESKTKEYRGSIELDREAIAEELDGYDEVDRAGAVK